jgi:quinol monooxygenase YgiN
MMDAIQTSARFPKIQPAQLAEFKQLAGEALESARGEAGTVQYDWFFSDDDTECVVRETYRDSEAVLAHLGNVGPLLGRMIDLGGGLELEVFGSPSAALRQAIAELQPAIYAHVQGK